MYMVKDPKNQDLFNSYTSTAGTYYINLEKQNSKFKLGQSKQTTYSKE